MRAYMCWPASFFQSPIYLESLLMTRMRAPFSSRILLISDRSISTALWDSFIFFFFLRERKKNIRKNNRISVKSGGKKASRAHAGVLK